MYYNITGDLPLSWLRDGLPYLINPSKLIQTIWQNKKE